MRLSDFLSACSVLRPLAWVASIVLAVACTSDEKAPGELAAGCLINSDCREPLVCAFRSCHNACSATRDCANGLRCVASDRPFHVCQLPSERSCKYHSDCPEGQVCGIDGQCRDKCHATADCLAEQLCVAGTCAEVAELRDGGLTPIQQDGAPATGQSCSYNSQCPDRLVCRAGSCQVECLTSIDCKSGRACIQNRCQVPLCPEADAGADAGGAVSCTFSSDCIAPLVCKSGTCTCECRVIGDCASGYDCVSNRCVPSNRDSIGPEGGILVSPDLRLTLVVPPGALSTRVHLTMEFAEAWPAGALGPVFEVRPSGTTFNSQVTFVYRYEPSDLAPFAPSAVRLGVANGASWTRLATMVDAVQRTVTAQTNHLSTYGLVAPDPTPPDASVDADAGPVDAGRCVGVACSGTISDGCCATNCTALTDVDCPGCGNGRLEAGETCDPPGSCPTCDDQNDCTTDTQTGTAATCNVSCQTTPKTCSNAGKDRCCPIGCTAQNDSDCAGCGDGMIDPTAGETCDPPSSCPTGCTPGQCWEVQTFTGSPATCNARCSTTQLPCSGTTNDSCCPPGCNTSPSNRDVDCPASCGNGIVDVGETCDPLSSCPMSCAQMGCTLRSLANGGTCQAQCQTSGTQTSCVNDDACCPTSCNAVNDNNCGAVCGNGVLEPGELCEGASCPASCPNQGCTIRALQGTGCQRECVDAGTIACGTNNDSCCPTGCTAMTDTDCSGCGNGRLEAGETCDPPGSCPSCDDANTCTTDSQTGSASTCNVVCTNTPKTCSNAGKDQCCPMGCTAGNDSDCAGCGDGIVDMTSGETCDPPSSCPTACTPGQCWEIKTFTGSPSTCNALCSTTLRPCSGLTADGCCPPGCNTSLSNRDVDCPAVCGNGAVESGETCDPLSSCPMSCPQSGCNLYTLVNGGTCSAACQDNGTQSACVNGDNCCPGGGAGACNTTNDNNCLPYCGNFIVESGELCDGYCPSSCANVGCTAYTLQGTGCQRECVASGTIACGTGGDGCCPMTGCNANLDSDCAAVCGNGVLESGELCDTGIGDGGAGACPTMCPNMGCTLRVLSGTACQAHCVNAPDGGTITGCVNGDNCCPPMCNASNDNNCSAVCGNGVIETGEICEPGFDGGAGQACPTAASCAAMGNQNFTFTLNQNGTPAFACDDTCTSSPRPCASGDGWCPSMCNPSNDGDCQLPPPPNDRCPNAIDITPGGVFTVDFPTSTTQNSMEACGAKGPDLFYTFTLDPKDGQQFIQLSMLDNPITGLPVPLTLELYRDECPPPDGAASAMDCDDGRAGEVECRRNPFPLLTARAVNPGKPGTQPHAVDGPLNPGKYFVAVRAVAQLGKWDLTFHHVPVQCAQQGELVPILGQPQFVQGNTCTMGDEYTPTTPMCTGPEPSPDANYLIYKCPSTLHVTTCEGRNALDTVLTAVRGSMTVNNGRCFPIAGAGQEVGCHNNIGTVGCSVRPNASELFNVGGLEAGLITVNVDGDKAQCNIYSIGADYK